MKRKINKIKLFVNDNEKSIVVAKDLELELKKYGFEVVDKNYDLAISVGGDGSFLRMVQETKFKNCYYIGVHAGTLGFLQEIDMNDSHDFVKRLNTNNFKTEDISVQETKIITEDKIYKLYDINEIVVRDMDFKVLRCEVSIDGEHLENSCGDGLLICTSTGSTAYNISSGGSIIYNTINALSLTPLCPSKNKISNNFINSIVVPENKKISLSFFKEPKDVLVIVDGVNYPIKNALLIETTVSKKRLKCVRMNDYHYIKIIKNKILGV